MDLVSILEIELGKKAQIKFLPMQQGDAPESWADIKKSIDMLDFNPTTNIDIGVKKFIEWYFSYTNS